MLKTKFSVISDGIDINGLIVRPGDGQLNPLVVLCHGAPSGNPPDPADPGYPGLAERFAGEGYAACFFNFRGTGESGGNLDFFKWTGDLSAVLDYLLGQDGFDRSHVYLCGSSAGGAVSIYVAAHDTRIAGVVACSSPSDFGLLDSPGGPASVIEHYRAIGAIRDPGFPPSVEDWFSDLARITPQRHIGGIAPRPVLIIHGTADETVDVRQSHRLYAAAGKPRELVLIEGAGHRLRRDERVIETIFRWLKSHCSV